MELSLMSMIQDLKRSRGPEEVIVAMNIEIRQLLSKLNARIQTMQKQVVESKHQDDREGLNKAYEWHTSQYNELEKNIRRANLIAKATMDSNTRKLLLQDVNPGIKVNRGDSLQAADTATESFVSLRQRLSSEVDQSKRSLEVLVQSSGQVAETDKEMENMSAHIQSSHRLLTKFSRREVTDSLLILCGVAFFFAVVLYILKKRLYG